MDEKLLEEYNKLTERADYIKTIIEREADKILAEYQKLRNEILDDWINPYLGYQEHDSQYIYYTGEEYHRGCYTDSHEFKLPVWYLYGSWQDHAKEEFRKELERRNAEKQSKINWQEQQLREQYEYLKNKFEGNHE